MLRAPMGPPSPPLPLTPANLAVLQTRQPSQAASNSDEKPTPDQPRAAPPSGSGRGRLVDIVV